MSDTNPTTVVVSVHKINDIELCSRIFRYNHILRIEPLEKPAYMEAGDIFHQCLDMHYRSKIGTKVMTHDEVVAAARAEVCKMDLPVEDGEDAIKSYIEYREFYENEEWIPEASEAPFAKELYADDDVRIIVEGKIDLLVTVPRTQERITVDHKRSGRDTEPPDRDNQKLCYAWASERSTFVINFVGTQKSKKVAERLKRYQFQYSQHQIDEWKESAIYNVMEMLRHQKMDIWPARYSSCTKFGKKCTFYDVCNTTPDNKAYKIATTMKPKKAHDLFASAEGAATSEVK